MKLARCLIIITMVLALITVTAGGCFAGGDKVAVIPLNGVIADAGQAGLLLSAGISPGLVRGYLSRAENDVRVKAVVLRINSPGGSAGASQEIAGEIRHFREQTGKPVVVSMGDIAASGGYYISLYADRIVANPATLTGSIGVINQFIYIDGLLEKLGLEMEIVKTGKHKDMGIYPLTDEQRRIVQQTTDQIYDQFVAAVAEGRSLPRQRVLEIATGQAYTGSTALEIGLVDELGGLHRALELVADLVGVAELEIEEYSQPSSFLQDLLGGLQSPLTLPFSGDELMFIEFLEGWWGMPRY
jgi:protease-4